tara:strand:+ start:4605 stop:5561 length:957 start_codon:yes stop_codon:yes gene_type:complete
MKKLLLVGSGQLGSRHFQSIMKEKIDLELTILENNESSLILTKKRLSEIDSQIIPKKVKWVKDINEIENHYSFAIVSTSAKNRALLINNLSKKTSIDYWIIEKVLAQSTEELEMIRLSTSSSKKVYINTSRRQMKWFHELRSNFFKGKKLEVTKSGYLWGLACNAIHYIDLIEWWSGEIISSVDDNSLNTQWIKSSRQDYFEVNGKLIIHFSKGSKLSLISKSENIPNILKIKTNNNTTWEIIEEEGIARSSKNQSLNGVFEFQSNMTGPMISKILKTGECNLPLLEKSITQHKIFLEVMLQNWNKFIKKNDTKVPIT